MGIVITAVPTLSAAFALAVTYQSSPIFAQERIGLHGKKFKIFKLKSLKNPYNEQGQRLPLNQRTTRIGNWVRKTKLDETPQFINVLKGEMSLVGPRPLSIDNKAVDNKLLTDPKRHSILPGMTGLAQLENIKKLTAEQVIALDHKYINKHNIKNDIIICLKTPFKIFKHYNQKHLNNEAFTQQESPTPP